MPFADWFDFPFGRKGPITRRIYDKESDWPRTLSIFQGNDAEDFVKKSAIMTRYTVLTAGFFSVYDIILWPRKDPGIASAISRIKFWSVPIVGGGLTYTAMVNLLSGLRGGKTDQWNHFWAGVSVGALVGKHAKCTLTGFNTALILGIAGYAAKDSVVHKWELFMEDRKGWTQQGNSLYHKYDYTMMPPRAGYWVRKEEDIPKMLERGQL